MIQPVKISSELDELCKFRFGMTNELIENGLDCNPSIQIWLKFGLSKIYIG